MQAATRMPRLDIHERWLIRKDMPQVLAIEASSFDQPWSENEFIHVLRCANNIMKVAECGEVIVGYICYQLQKSSLTIINMAVHEDYRRRGVGTALVRTLACKLSASRRKRLVANVEDGNLDGHLFFKACGFRATNILRKFFAGQQDAYHFVKQFRGSKA